MTLLFQVYIGCQPCSVSVKYFAGSYLLAKVLEAADKPVYEWTHHIVSGHTLKHLSAALVPVFLTLMLAKRAIDNERYYLLCC